MPLGKNPESQSAQPRINRGALEIKGRDNRLQESEQKLQHSQEKELEIRKQTRELEAREKSLDKELDKYLKEEATKLEEKLNLRAREDTALEVDDINCLMSNRTIRNS